MKIIIYNKIIENNSDNSNTVYNAQFMLKNNWSNGKNIAQTIIGDSTTKLDVILRFVEGIPPLQNNKIIKAVANSVNGNIFKLSNGRILKLFGAAYQNPEEDFKWYQENANKIYSGTADINTLPVFRTGKTRVGTSNIYFAEMAELYPLDKWLSKRSGDADTAIQLLYVAYLTAFKRNNKLTPDQYADMVLKIIENKDFAGSGYEDKIGGGEFEITYKPFTELEARSFVKALSKMMASNFKFNDVAARNIGILPSSSSRDIQYLNSQDEEPVMVIFDR